MVDRSLCVLPWCKLHFRRQGEAEACLFGAIACSEPAAAFSPAQQLGSSAMDASAGRRQAHGLRPTVKAGYACVTLGHEHVRCCQLADRTLCNDVSVSRSPVLARCCSSGVVFTVGLIVT